MSVKLITFDCAETLVGVRWSVGDFALDCARHVGLDLAEPAADRYRQMYHERLPEFLRVNMTRDVRQGDAFWQRLAGDWLAEMGLSREWVQPLMEASEELGFGPGSILFSLFEDVLPSLQSLKDQGYALGVVSNWDYSLAKTLRAVGIDHFFDFAIASLEEGFEKPDPRIFRLAADKAGVSPAETLHVGDNPLDDLNGARNAGMLGVLVDRSRESTVPPYMRTLLDLPEAIAWMS